MPAWAACVLGPITVLGATVVGGNTLVAGDRFYYYLPLHILTADALRDGALPEWNTFQFSGGPFLATSQTAFLYPPNLVFLALPALLANYVVVVSSFVLASTGTYLLARRLTGDAAGAAVAGLGFGLTGFFFAHFSHQSLLATTCWLPWSIYGLDLVRERITAGRASFAVAVFALAALANHAQMFAFLIAVALVYALALAVADNRSALGRVVRFAAAACVVLALLELTVLPPTSITTAVLFVSAILLGAATAVAVLALVRTAGRRAEAGERLVATSVLVVLCACVVAAAQLLPAVSVLESTSRAHLDFAEATAFSLPPSHVPLQLFPYLFGSLELNRPYDEHYRGDWNISELVAYPGAACLVLASAGLVALRRDRRIAALGAASVAAFVAALGKATTFGALVYFVPVFGQFRSWGRYLVLVCLVVALLAGYGIAELRRRDAGSRRRAFRRAAVAAAAVVVAALAVLAAPALDNLRAPERPGYLAVALPVAAALGGLVAALATTRFRALGAVFAGVIVVVDAPFVFGLWHEWGSSVPAHVIHATYDRERPAFWGRVPGASDSLGRYIYTGRELSPILPEFLQATSLKEMRSANGYDPLAPAQYQAAVGDLRADGGMDRPSEVISPRSRLPDLLQVTTVLTPPTSLPLPQRFGRGHRVGGGRLVRHEYRPQLPGAFVAGRVSRLERAQVLAAVYGRTPWNPLREALIDQRCDACRSMRTARDVGRVSAVVRDHSTISVRLASTRPGLLVVSEAWFPGWTATVDGRKAEVVRANGVLLGVPLPARAGDVRLVYRAPGLRAGLLLSGFGVTLLVAVVTVRTFRTRRGSTASASGPGAPT